MDDIINRATELYQTQDGELIEKMILLILKEQKVSLSQTIGIFNHIIEKIEHENPVNL